jgi:glutamine cyclotransferase
MKKNVTLIAIIAYCLLSCGQNKPSASQISIISPEAGTIVKSGASFSIQLDLPSGTKADSIVYLLDSAVVARKADTSRVNVTTSEVSMGNHLVTARVYTGKSPEDVTSNIVIVASKAPVQYTYQIVNTYPHDTSSYVEGLEYHDGVFYESDGQYGMSSLRKVEVKTGKVLQKVDIPKEYFAEGITVIGDKIIQLTYKEGVGFIYDKNSFKKLGEFPYQAGAEGWALFFDGKRILNTDGTNNIYFLNKDTYQKEGALEVYDDKGPVDSLNELEVIDGEIYANVYRIETPKILMINPQTGIVEGEVDLKGLVPKEHADNSDYILNGIAWDAAGRRLFVTGKTWDKLYEIKVIKE